MLDNKEYLQTQILNLWNIVKNTDSPAHEKMLKQNEDIYRYHYEGGSRPSHYPPTSNKTWMYCQHCDYERQLTDKEKGSEDTIALGCPNNCNKGHFFATERRPRNKSNSWLDNYKESREREREREREITAEILTEESVASSSDDEQTHQRVEAICQLAVSEKAIHDSTNSTINTTKN